MGSARATFAEPVIVLVIRVDVTPELSVDLVGIVHGVSVGAGWASIENGFVENETLVSDPGTYLVDRGTCSFGLDSEREPSDKYSKELHGEY